MAATYEVKELYSTADVSRGTACALTRGKRLLCGLGMNFHGDPSDLVVDNSGRDGAATKIADDCMVLV